jgi:transcriptional regulator with XRE-family HTH domain
MIETAASWTEEGYADVVSASLSAADLEVEFANGDVVLIAASNFGVSGEFEVSVDPADGMSVDVVSGTGEPLKLPWTLIRSAADPVFAQEMRRRETEEARRIGLRLRALREDKNLNQRDVARIVGMSPPQLSKIESGALDIRVSTVQSLLRAMGGTFADISGDAPEVSRKAVVKSAEKMGVPRDLMSALLTSAPRRSLAGLVERAFGWRLDHLTAGAIERHVAPAGVAFKATSGKDPSESPLVLLGQTIADIARQASTAGAFSGLPVEGHHVHLQARDQDGQVTLASLTRWAWSRGVPVVPLAGRGDFSAAVWNGADAPVIVLKETRELAAYWLFDLAHECAHIALGHVGDAGLVDVDSPSPRESSDAMEQAANEFALEVLVPNHRDLLSQVRREARGSHLRFKGAVATVADAANVNAGVLGLIAAYALTEVGQEKDRWGSATNLARDDGPGRALVQAVARARLALQELNEVDALLIRQLVLEGLR